VLINVIINMPQVRIYLNKEEDDKVKKIQQSHKYNLSKSDTIRMIISKIKLKVVDKKEVEENGQ